jgi:hypothetical protein
VVLIVFSEDHNRKSVDRSAPGVSGRVTGMLPKSLMNSRRLMGFTPLAESYLRESLIRPSSESYAPRRILRPEISMSALPPKADIGRRDWDVCFVPIADIFNYSITSSANNKNDSGTVRPRPLAVFKFTTKLNFVGS